MEKEIIQLNPNLDIDGAKRQKKQMYMVDKSSNIRTDHNSSLDRIRTYILQHNQELTVVFRWDEATRVWWIGIMLPWMDSVSGIPPKAKKEEKPFAEALWREYVRVRDMGEVNFLAEQRAKGNISILQKP